MKSQWEHLRSDVVQLRRDGNSIRDIESKLGIPRSTLSGWLSNVSIAKRHKAKLHRRWLQALIHARKKAVVWHHAQKGNRLEKAKGEASDFLTGINEADPRIAELSLALLYLGEGMKKSPVTALGNSDPLILNFFCATVRKIYNVPVTDLKCELHIRADQSPAKEKLYWADALGIPLTNFGHVSIDERTRGRPTYEGYHGVCIVRCGRIAIQRKLVYIAKTFCERFVEKNARG